MFSLRQQATISCFECILQGTRLHPAPVNEECDMLPVILCQGTVANIAMYGIWSLIMWGCPLRVSGSFLTGRHAREQFGQGQVVEFGQCGSEITTTSSLQGDMFFDYQVEAHGRIAYCIALQEL